MVRILAGRYTALVVSSLFLTMLLSSLLPLGQALAHTQPNGHKHAHLVNTKNDPPDCTPDRVSGAKSTVVAATCSGFPADEQIQVLFNNTSQVIGTANTGSGTFSVTYTIPENAKVGTTVVIEILDIDQSEFHVQKIFTVTSALTPAPSPIPTLPSKPVAQHLDLHGSLTAIENQARDKFRSELRSLPSRLRTGLDCTLDFIPDNRPEIRLIKTDIT